MLFSDKPVLFDYRLQSSCQDILHSKKVLLLIVLLNILDCLLVLAGLILDINYIKGTNNQSDFTVLAHTVSTIKLQKKEEKKRIYNYRHLFDKLTCTLIDNTYQQQKNIIPTIRTQTGSPYSLA